MVAATYDAAMVRVFADEGGYTNDPKDPGGPTNWGITIWDARKFWKTGATAEDVKAMPKSVAVDIYKQRYAIPIRYNDLPAGFDYSVLDAEINSGIGRALPWAGKALQCPDDIEDVVSHAKTSADKVALIQRYWDLRLGFLHSLSTWSHFGPGWGRRCASGEAASVKMWLMIGAGATQVETSTRMRTEASKAGTKVTKASTGAVATGGGTALSAPALDWAHIGLGGKVAAVIAATTLITFVIYLVRRATIHNARATAYASAA